jgi:hypothetical protein
MMAKMILQMSLWRWLVCDLKATVQGRRAKGCDKQQGNARREARAAKQQSSEAVKTRATYEAVKGILKDGVVKEDEKVGGEKDLKRSLGGSLGHYITAATSSGV